MRKVSTDTNPQKLPIVEVVWEDANSMEGWHTIGDVDRHTAKPFLCSSIGYLYRDTEIGVILAQSQVDTSQLGDVLSIPRANIKEMRYLRAR